MRRRKRSRWRRQHKSDADGNCLPLLPPTLIVAFCLLALVYGPLCAVTPLCVVLFVLIFFTIQSNQIPLFLLSLLPLGIKFTKLEKSKHMHASVVENTLICDHGKAFTIISFATTGYHLYIHHPCPSSQLIIDSGVDKEMHIPPLRTSK